MAACMEKMLMSRLTPAYLIYLEMCEKVWYFATFFATMQNCAVESAFKSNVANFLDFCTREFYKSSANIHPNKESKHGKYQSFVTWSATTSLIAKDCTTHNRRTGLYHEKMWKVIRSNCWALASQSHKWPRKNALNFFKAQSKICLLLELFSRRT